MMAPSSSLPERKCCVLHALSVTSSAIGFVEWGELTLHNGTQTWCSWHARKRGLAVVVHAAPEVYREGLGVGSWYGGWGFVVAWRVLSCLAGGVLIRGRAHRAWPEPGG